MQAGITPSRAIDVLKTGNVCFVAGNVKRHVTATALGQYPFASELSCVETCAAPERVLDQTIGDFFIPRLAGNVVNRDVLGSLKYAAKLAGSRLIVVLGHTHCGAVKGACDGVKMGDLTGLLAKIRPAVAATKMSGTRDVRNRKFAEDVAELNVDLAINTLRAKSPILKKLDVAGKVATYDTATGKVIWR